MESRAQQVDMLRTSPTLLQRVRDPADELAWHQFDSIYGELIVRYSRRCGLRYLDAEDIRQIVMLRLSKAMRNFEYDPARGRFRGYLGRVVQHEITRHLARRVEEPRVLDLVDEETRPQPTTAWEEEWVQHHLRRGMHGVRQSSAPRNVEIFEQLLQGNPVDAIASQHGMTTDAVHKVKQRIRDRLKIAIRQQIREEDGDGG